MNIPKLPLALIAASIALAGCGSETAPVPTAPETVGNGSAPAPETGAIAENAATPDAMAETAPAASNSATETPDADETEVYRVRGQVVEVPAANGVIVVQHEEIPGFMDAMEMRLPLKNAADAKTIKPGDKIAFDMDKGNIKVSNIEQLAPDTALTLKK